MKSLISPTVNKPVSPITKTKSEWTCVRNRFLAVSSSYLFLISVFSLNRFLKHRSHKHEDPFSVIVLVGCNKCHYEIWRSRTSKVRYHFMEFIKKLISRFTGGYDIRDKLVCWVGELQVWGMGKNSFLPYSSLATGHKTA